MNTRTTTLLLACLLALGATFAAAPVAADWPSWRGDGSGAANSGAAMVDSLDKAKLAWQSDPVGLSGCMYPGGSPGEGWCDPVIADGRVYVYWFRRAGDDLVDLHYLPASRGWASLIDPPDNPEAFARGGGHRSSLPSKEMSPIMRHVRADDIVTCLDDRTGKKLWERVFPLRGINNPRIYGPLCTPCVSDGVLYALGSAGRVYALDAATGKTRWESDMGLRAEQFDQMMEVFARSRHRASDIGTALDVSVVCADGVVAIGEGSSPVGRGASGMVGLDAATGRRLWTVPNCLDNLGTPAVWRHDGKEYLLAVGDRMVLVEPKTGKVLWEIGGPTDPITEGCAPAVSGDYVVVAKNVMKTAGQKDFWRGPSCYKISQTGAERVWALPMVEGISLIAPSIMGKHAYVCAKGGVACVELETGTVVGQSIPGFSSAYAGYAAGDGLVFRLGKVAKGFPEMTVLGGTLPGKPDFGEIHAPAVANGRVYWRGKRSVWCYDFRKEPPAPSDAVLPTARDLTAIADDPAALVKAAEEPWPTRAAAVDRLRQLGEKAKPAALALHKLLLAAAAVKDWGETDLLLDALLAIDPAATKPAATELAKLLASPDALTVRLGLHGLARMGPQAADAVPALVTLLDPEKPDVAALAAAALGHIGPGARAAVPVLVPCLSAKDPGLSCQAAKALCHIGPTDADARAATINAVLAQPWFVRIDGGATCPMRNSYRAVVLSLLGKDAVPQMLKAASAVIEAGVKTPKASIPYTTICDLADAAYAIDPASAPDFLPLLEKIPNRNPPVVDRVLLKMTTDHLKGTLDQRDPLGRLKSNTPPPAGNDE